MLKVVRRIINSVFIIMTYGMLFTLRYFGQVPRAVFHGMNVLISSLIVLLRMIGTVKDKATVIHPLVFASRINTVLQSFFGCRLATFVTVFYAYTSFDYTMLRGLQGALSAISFHTTATGLLGLWRNFGRLLSLLSAAGFVTFTCLAMYQLNFVMMANCIEYGIAALTMLAFTSQLNNTMDVIFMSHALVAVLVAIIVDGTLARKNEATRKDQVSHWWGKAYLAINVDADNSTGHCRSVSQIGVETRPVLVGTVSYGIPLKNLIELQNLEKEKREDLYHHSLFMYDLGQLTCDVLRMAYDVDWPEMKVMLTDHLPFGWSLKADSISAALPWTDQKDKAAVIQPLFFASRINTVLQSFFGCRLATFVTDSYAYTSFDYTMLRSLQGALSASSSHVVAIGLLSLRINFERLLSLLSAAGMLTFTGLAVYQLDIVMMAKCVEYGLPALTMLPFTSQLNNRMDVIFMSHALGAVLVVIIVDCILARKHEATRKDQGSHWWGRAYLAINADADNSTGHRRSVSQIGVEIRPVLGGTVSYGIILKNPIELQNLHSLFKYDLGQLACDVLRKAYDMDWPEKKVMLTDLPFGWSLPWNRISVC